MSQILLEEYANSIHVDDRYESALLTGVNQEKLVLDLLDLLVKEQKQISKADIPFDYRSRRNLLKGLLTVREAAPLPADYINKMDTLLQLELEDKGVVQMNELASILAAVPHCRYNQADKFVLWQGDITRLGADAIVNAANKYLLGCFQPYHACIDNAIHSAAGPQLREDCNVLMSMQGELEWTGGAKITRGYNLPARYVLHTVGPIVSKGTELTDQHRAELAACYRACLELAAEIPGIKIIAFCAISTGVFGFPKQEAATIAAETVNDWLNTNTHHFERIIFNVFSEEDYQEYLHVFNR